MLTLTSMGDFEYPHGRTRNLHTESLQSATRFKPRTIMLWGDSANHDTVILPHLSSFMLLTSVHSYNMYHFFSGFHWQGTWLFHFAILSITPRFIWFWHSFTDCDSVIQDSFLSPVPLSVFFPRAISGSFPSPLSHLAYILEIEI